MNVRREKIREVIYSTPGIGRRELGDVTGLDSRTIVRGLENLLRQGVIRAEAGVRGRGAGRPGEAYYPEENGTFHVAGIYLDLTRITCVVSRENGEEIGRLSEPFCIELASVSHAVRRCVRILELLERKHSVKISSVALTVRDRRDPRFLRMAERLLERLIRIPVHGTYPIEAFAWAEQSRFPRAKRILAIHFYHEIEICLLDHLRIMEEGRSFATELLHTTVDPEGPPCWCGKNGCMENYVNEYILNEEFRMRKGMRPSSGILTLPEYVGKGDPVALELFRRQEDCILLALRKTAELFHPDRMVLVALPENHLVREMKRISGGKWIPEKLRSSLFFRVENSLKSGGTCVSAAVQTAVFKEKQVRFSTQTER